jgi:hypothetical protein
MYSKAEAEAPAMASTALNRISIFLSNEKNFKVDGDGEELIDTETIAFKIFHKIKYN